MLFSGFISESPFFFSIFFFILVCILLKFPKAAENGRNENFIEVSQKCRKKTLYSKLEQKEIFKKKKKNENGETSECIILKIVEGKLSVAEVEISDNRSLLHQYKRTPHSVLFTFPFTVL